MEELSGGKVGYVHVQGMNDQSYRTTYEDVLGKAAGKEALIVDTRFNGGGWLHDDLVTFLSGKKYLSFSPQGATPTASEPANKWTNPSTVLMSESNYSDAFIFPYAYKSLGIGKLIGMPVPGTGTAVWWEQQIDPSTRRVVLCDLPSGLALAVELRDAKISSVTPTRMLWTRGRRGGRRLSLPPRAQRR